MTTRQWLKCGMFIRRDRKSSRKGEQRVYISLAHNVRERLPDGSTRPKPITFARLGREEDLDADLVIQMRDALDRYLRKRFGDVTAQPTPSGGRAVVGVA